METLTPAWLQYGALGLLALVLVGWFFQNKNDQARADRTWTFVEQLAQNAIKGLAETTEKLQGVLSENTKVMALLCEKLDDIPKEIERNGQETREVVVRNGDQTRQQIAGLKGPLRRGT